MGTRTREDVAECSGACIAGNSGNLKTPLFDRPSANADGDAERLYSAREIVTVAFEPAANGARVSVCGRVISMIYIETLIER